MSAKQINLLFVDDDVTNLDYGAALASGLGYPATLATSGETTVDLVRTKPREFDLIFLDYQMPGMDGCSTAKAIRQLEEESGHRSIIVAATGKRSKDAKAKCLAAGMDDFYTKPLSEADLLEVLNKWFSSEK